MDPVRNNENIENAQVANTDEVQPQETSVSTEPETFNTEAPTVNTEPIAEVSTEVQPATTEPTEVSTEPTTDVITDILDDVEDIIEFVEDEVLKVLAEKVKQTITNGTTRVRRYGKKEIAQLINISHSGAETEFAKDESNPNFCNVTIKHEGKKSTFNIATSLIFDM